MTTTDQDLQPAARPADVELIDDDIDDDEIEGDGAPGATAWKRPSRRRWVLFGALAIGILVIDQLTKAWITGTLAPGESVEVLGSWLRIVYWTNSGILFGMLPQSAPAFAVVSAVVVGLIVVYHAKAGRGLMTTVALGLLLGGAIGNLIDRLRHGAVVDWVDMGIGTARFYTYNMADAAITTAITLLLLMALFPRLADWSAE
jgi:signal peptidase II